MFKRRNFTLLWRTPNGTTFTHTTFLFRPKFLENCKNHHFLGSQKFKYLGTRENVQF